MGISDIFNEVGRAQPLIDYSQAVIDTGLAQKMAEQKRHEMRLNQVQGKQTISVSGELYELSPGSLPVQVMKAPGEGGPNEYRFRFRKANYRPRIRPGMMVKVDGYPEPLRILEVPPFDMSTNLLTAAFLKPADWRAWDYHARKVVEIRESDVSKIKDDGVLIWSR